MRLAILISVLLMTSLLIGCSDQKQIKGKVTLLDGTPLANGRVIFEKEGFNASGEIQKDGSYIMGTLKHNDGVPKGEYLVYVTGATKHDKTFEMKTYTVDMKPTTVTMPSFEPVVSKKHSSPYTTDIKCNVNKSMTFDFSVEPAE